MSRKEDIPRSALIIGWSGVLPFALLAVFIATSVNVTGAIDPRNALIKYAAIILSFMGGVHWGIAIDGKTMGGTGTSSQPLRLGLSTVPALVGWVAIFFPFGIGVSLLIGAFLVLVVYDIWAATQEWIPSWYPRLRMQLTTAVVAALALAWSSG